MGREPLYAGQDLESHSVKVLAAHWATLGMLARNGHTSRSALIREALDTFIARRLGPAAPEREAVAV